jgi:threonine dehydrogenase-like Zn-dependent dehydrogenase
MPTQALEDIVEVLNATGRLGIVGVYIAPDPGAPTEARKQGRFELPLAKLFEKTISIGMGQCPVKRYNTFLRDQIVAGRARPSYFVSQRPSLDEAPEAYERFDRRARLHEGGAQARGRVGQAPAAAGISSGRRRSGRRRIGPRPSHGSRR